MTCRCWATFLPRGTAGVSGHCSHRGLRCHSCGCSQSPRPIPWLLPSQGSCAGRMPSCFLSLSTPATSLLLQETTLCLKGLDWAQLVTWVLSHGACDLSNPCKVPGPCNQGLGMHSWGHSGTIVAYRWRVTRPGLIRTTQKNIHLELLEEGPC